MSQILQAEIQHARLFARSTVDGPLDLAAELHAAGMTAAAWQVEALQEELEGREQDDEDTQNKLDAAIVAAEKAQEELDDIDAALLKITNALEDEAYEASTKADRAKLRAALVAAIEDVRMNVQGARGRLDPE